VTSLNPIVWDLPLIEAAKSGNTQRGSDMATATEVEWFESRMRWGAVFSGLVVGFAIQLALTLLGMAIGAWSLDLRESNRGVPIGTGIWTAISMLIAAFTGGYVTAYMSGSWTRRDGMLHGAVVWGLTWLLSAWLATTAMAVLAGGIFNVFGEGLKALGSGVGTAVSKIAEKSGQVDLSQLGLSKDKLRSEIESTFRATGKPELQPEAMRSEAERTAGQAGQGQSLRGLSDTAMNEVYEKLAALDEEAAINVLVKKGGLSETQAREVIQSVTGGISQLRDRAQGLKERSIDTANTAIQRMGTAAWWLFVLAVLTLATTMLGAAIGTAAEAMVADRIRMRSRREAV
jgi:hypothetical protein